MQKYLAGLLLCLPISVFAVTSPSPIRIGHVDSLTGPDSVYGVSLNDGINVAIEEANARGGIRGHKIELLTLDDRGSSAEAATATSRLIVENKVVAIIGESISSRALAMAPLAQSRNIPFISPGATASQLTKVGDFIFRACFIDSFQGKVLAKFALEKLHWKTMGILKDLSSANSMDLAKAFSQSYQSLGGKVVYETTYSAGDIDFRSQLLALKQSNPEAIFVPAFYSDAASVARQAKEQGIHVPLLGGDGWGAPGLLTLAGPAVEGSYLVGHFLAENKSESSDRFVKKFETKFHRTPWEAEAMGYDTANLLLQAISASPQLTSLEIKNALARTRDFPGVMGKISLDADRNAVMPLLILRVKNGKFVYDSTVNPDLK